MPIQVFGSFGIIVLYVSFSIYDLSRNSRLNFNDQFVQFQPSSHASWRSPHNARLNSSNPVSQIDQRKGAPQRLHTKLAAELLVLQYSQRTTWRARSKILSNASTALSFKDLNSIMSKDLGLVIRTLYTGCSLTVPAACLSRNWLMGLPMKSASTISLTILPNLVSTILWFVKTYLVDLATTKENIT
jgi:hypothetical protein